jgi:hypothetical protein
MSNSLSGFQIVATNGLLNGDGLTPPNIVANISSYYALSPVNNFNTIYYNANVANVNITNTNALRSLGANSFPHIFGQVPYDFSSALNEGPLFEKIQPRISHWFGNIMSSSILIQVLSDAQVYAQQSSDLINSAASAQWASGPSATASGGFSLLAKDTKSLQSLSNAFKQLGNLLLFSNPLSGFSNAGCFKQILKSGNSSIGNLHINFFGKTLYDSTTGISYIINEELMDLIINNPKGKSDNDSFQIVALNHLDYLLGIIANSALTDTGDLDAVITFFDIIGSSASSINQWTDCLNISLMLGTEATTTIRNSLNLSSTDTLDTYALIKLLLSSIKGLGNLISLVDLGNVMSNVTLLPNSNLSLMTSPVSISDYANLKATVGFGSGKNANPTVLDLLGATNLNDALVNTINGLTPLFKTDAWSNISSDTGNVANALINGISSLIYLSDGTSYSNINVLCANAVTLINSEAISLIPNIVNANLFSDYNSIAETHNNSILLTPISGIDIWTLSPDNVPLMGFPSQLSSMAVESLETSGLDFVLPLFDNSITGQALTAIVIESKNNKLLSDSGLISSSFDSNPETLPSSPTGVNTVGGGRVK